MKKLLVIALLPLALYSCEKDEITNPQFRPITCEDTTDDGIFEEYTQPEVQEFLRFYKEIPEVADANFLDSIAMTSRILYNNSTVYDPILVYKQNRKSNLIVYVPTGGPGKYYSWVQNDTTVMLPIGVPIYTARTAQLPVGCHRLYYVFADTAFGTVLNKGHFDFEVRK